MLITTVPAVPPSVIPAVRVAVGLAPRVREPLVEVYATVNVVVVGAAMTKY